MTVRQPDQDLITAARIGITFPHHEIHEGDSYVVGDSAQGGSGTTLTFQLTTPNTSKWVHIIPSIRSSVEAIGEIFEGGNYSGAVANLVTPVNRNRNCGENSDVIVKQDVVISGATSGTKLLDVQLGAGVKTGGFARSQEEWILKSGTEYLFVAGAQAASAEIGIELNWYEHTNSTA